jgi:hypothetical protein
MMLSGSRREYRRDVAMICDLGELPAGTVTGLKDPLEIAIPYLIGVSVATLLPEC